MTRTVAGILVLLLSSSVARSQTRGFALESLEGLKLHNVRAEAVTYKGKKGLRVTEPADRRADGEDTLAILTGTDFRDGTIEVEVSGQPGSGAAEAARGF